MGMKHCGVFFDGYEDLGYGLTIALDLMFEGFLAKSKVVLTFRDD